MWLIIGYGNCLRSDDAVGYRVAERLRQQLPVEQVKVLSVHQLTPELVEELVHPEIEQVLFIDAKRNQPGNWNLSKLDLQAQRAASTGHQQQPELLLYAASELYGRSLPGWLLTVRGVDFGFGEELSQTTRDLLPEILVMVEKLIKKRAAG